MKYKFLAVVLLLTTESVFSVTPEEPPLGVRLQEFFAGAAVNDTLAIVSGGVAPVTDHLKSYNKKMIDGVVPNLGSTLTAKEQTEGVSKVKSTFESIKKNAMSLFSPKPAAALEQGKVPTPKARRSQS